MQEARTWRELLGMIISDNKMKQHLVDTLKVTPITLTRWISGESVPRPQNLRQLIAALPQHRDNFHRLIKEERGETEETLLPAASHEVQRVIPSEFYTRVLSTRATTNENLRFWSTSHLILQQAIGQLDPERHGMSIWIVSCMPPSGPYQKVRSLRENVGLGTPPWPTNLEQDALFLGAESLAGNVVTLCRPGIIQDMEQEHLIVPAQHAEFEKSSAIYPILYAGRIAGVFLVSSTVPNYFQAQSFTDLIQQYAELAALAFEPQQFYTPDQIALCVMPKLEEQKKHFIHFRSLVQQVMLESSFYQNPINNLQADMIVWQRLEETLLHQAELGTQ